MHRRPLRYRTSIASFDSQVQMAGENRWIVRQILQYGQRLVGFLQLTPEAVSFFSEILPRKERWALAEKLNIGMQGRMAQTDSSNSVDIAEVVTNWLNSKESAASVNDLRNVLSDAISSQLATLDNTQNEIETLGSSRLYEEMDELVSLFHLSCDELSILAFCYCYTVCPYLENLCDSLARRNQIQILSACVQVPQHQVSKILKKYEKLTSQGIIVKHNGTTIWAYHLSDHVEEYLSGATGGKFAELYCERFDRECFDLNTFDLPANYKDILSSLVENPKPYQINLQKHLCSERLEVDRHLRPIAYIFEKQDYLYKFTKKEFMYFLHPLVIQKFSHIYEC